MGMSDIAIRVESLSKRYRLGSSQKRPDTLMGAVKGAVMRPVTNFRRLRGMTRFDRDEENILWALKDVSFDVSRGDVVGIIGRNGAGKSTLLKIISRITAPTSGRITIHGTVSSLLEVGTGFHPELTGRDNTYLNGTILGMTRAEIDKKFDEIVEFSGIEKFIDTPVKFYSSGMRVRLAFAVAAHLEPEILIIDEVLAVGDAEFQRKCLGKMQEVGKGGRTVLFVSHNMNAVDQLCNCAIYLERGTVRNTGRDVRAMIKEYIFGDYREDSANRWERQTPEYDSQYYTPLAMYVADREGNEIPMPISNDAEAWLHLEMEVRQSDPALTVGFAVYSEDGALMFWSFHTDGVESRWPVLEPGRVVLRARLPERMLNEGTYRVEFIGSLHFRQWLMEPGVSSPAIYVTIQGGLSDSPYWLAKRPGAIAPVVAWENAADPAAPGAEADLARGSRSR